MKIYKKNNLLVKEFLEFIEMKRRYSHHTIRAYKKDLLDLIEYLGDDKLIADVNKYDLHEFVSHLSPSISSRTLARKIATIKSFYKFRYKLMNNIIFCCHIRK